MNLSLVSYLDKTTMAEVKILQQALYEVTGSKVSLLCWEPHITIGDGISVKYSELDETVRQMEKVARSFKPFSQRIAGFSGSDNRPIGAGESSTPYALWVNVDPESILIDLVSRVKAGVTSNHSTWYRMSDPYLPHVTLAFRDLDKQGYLAGLDYLRDKKIELLVEINHIALVEQQDRLDKEYKRFMFTNS